MFFLVLCVCGKLSSSENIVTSFVVKIARMAKYSEVTTASVWDHFVTAVVPAIQKWQLDGSDKAGSCDLGHLLTQAVEKAHNSDEDTSEVMCS